MLNRIQGKLDEMAKKEAQKQHAYPPAIGLNIVMMGIITPLLIMAFPLFLGDITGLTGLIALQAGIIVLCCLILFGYFSTRMTPRRIQTLKRTLPAFYLIIFLALIFYSSHIFLYGTVLLFPTLYAIGYIAVWYSLFYFVRRMTVQSS